MTLADLRAIAQYHRTEADQLTDAVLRIEAGGDQVHAEMLMHMRNRLTFHNRAALQLHQLAQAFTTFGGLTADIPATGT